MSQESIEVSNLCKTFPTKNRMGIKALEMLSFSCKKGVTYGLLGPNGSGKTTCLRILGGIIRPTSGSVKVSGIDLSNGCDKVREVVGFVSCTAQPYNRMTPKEILLYCGRLVRLGEALEDKVALLINEFGISDFQDRRCITLSTGMKQRVAIARSLIHDPKVLIFDEPMTGLDILARRNTFDIINRLKAGDKTILFSTHIPEEADRLCDFLFLLGRGHLIASGTPSELRRISGTDNLEDAFIKLLKDDSL